MLKGYQPVGTPPSTVVYLLITDSEKVIAKKLTIGSKHSLILLDKALGVAEKLLGNQPMESISKLDTTPLAVLVRVSNLLSNDAIPLASLVLDSDAIEDAFFSKLRHLEKRPTALKIESMPTTEVTDDNLWQSLAYAVNANYAGNKVALSFKKYERMDNVFLPNLEMVFNELKHKYYPVSSNPLFAIVPASAPFLACTRTQGEDIVIDISEVILGDPQRLRQALAHELIHWRIFREGEDVATHGETFQKYADEINAIEGANYVTVYADDLC